MRQRRKGRKLGRRTSAHRWAMLRNLVMDLIEHEKVQTTVTRAKEASRLADRMITLGRGGSLHDRRLAAKVITRNDLLQKLFGDIAKRNEQRVSGYTRILRLPPRKGDAAAAALWELVDMPKPVAEEAAAPTA